jgi:hypothetical protein
MQATTVRSTKSLAVETPSTLELRLASAIGSNAISQPSSIRPTDELATPEIPESVLKLVRAEVKELSGLLEQLSELRQEEPNDDYGILRLEESAFEHARELLTNATIVLAIKHQHKMPYGCASTDSEGGLRIEWFRTDVSVHLVIHAAAAGGKQYIFHQIHGASVVENDVTAETLAVWLSQVGD